ncbi:MAG: FAD-dependent oxidoreductase, partial [Coriobacteriales bacterium]|nr:FAD-dependent oxidoreductase [Coriobacteriales bacterium]
MNNRRKQHTDQGEKALQEPLQREISRRSMLFGTGIAVAGVATAGLVGCSPAEPSPPAAPAADQTTGTTDDLWALDPVGEPTETLEADLVVIGGGGTGLAAATMAQQLGLSTVVLEKLGTPGGSYICTEGMFVFDSHWQKEAGVVGDFDTLLARLMDYHHWIPRPELYRTFVMETAETVDWCESIGCEYGMLATIGETPQSFLAWKHDPNSDSSPGSEFAASLAQAAEDAGAQMLFQTSGKKILRENGAVAGVLAEDSGGIVTQINAPAVLIATGGYGQSEEMLKELAHFIGKAVEPGTPGRVGDGMKLGLDAGAQLWDYPGTLPLLGPLVAGAGWEPPMVITSFQPTLWINQDCERFIGEDTLLINFTYAGQAAKNQERTFSLLTEAEIDRFEQEGPYADIFTMGHVGTPVKGVKERLEQLSAEGTVFIADTLDDVAALAGLDPAALRACVEQYNGYCATGVDPEFNKAAQYLNPLDSSPYYLLEKAVCFTGSGGCLKVDTEMRCLDADRQPI